MNIACSHPRIILSPQFPELLGKYHCYVVDGREFYYKCNYRLMHDAKSLSFIYAYKKLVNHDNISSFYVLDKETGATYPIFIEVPCGHCEICKHKRVQQLVERCRLESQSYDYRPMFVTLTYNNYNLPDDGLSLRDIQLYLKRLRVNLERFGYRERIRYMCCGEYGKLGRAHYHLIIWNLHQSQYLEYKEVQSILEYSWQKGFVTSRLVDPTNDKSFFYTSKYLLKDCKVPVGCNPTFLVYSRGNGSIGSRKIDELAPSVRRQLNINFQYFDKWKQKAVPLPLCSYVLNRIFPSLARSISSRVRSAVKKFDYYFNDFKYRDSSLTWLFEDTYNKISAFSDYIYYGCKGLFEHPVNGLSDAQVYGHLCELQPIIEKALQKLQFYSVYAELDRLRNVFIGKFGFAPLRNFDISSYEYRCRRQRLRSHSTEIL